MKKQLLTNQHQVIMPYWLSKVPSWLRKNALPLSLLAFSNFAEYVIRAVIMLLQVSKGSFRDLMKVVCEMTVRIFGMISQKKIIEDSWLKDLAIFRRSFPVVLPLLK